MNRKIALAAAFMAVAALAGCAQAPMETVHTENPNIEYSVLFNRNGCEIGRFYDHGRPVYVTTCPEAGTSSSQWSHSESCGKNCTTTVNNENMQVRGDIPFVQHVTPR